MDHFTGSSIPRAHTERLNGPACQQVRDVPRPCRRAAQSLHLLRASGQAGRAPARSRTAAPGRLATRGTFRCGRVFTSNSACRRRPTVRDVSPDSVAVRLQPKGGDAVRAAPAGPAASSRASSGWLRPKSDLSGVKSLAVYIEPAGPLKPATNYTVHVSAGRPARARAIPKTPGPGASPPRRLLRVQAIEFPLDLGTAPVRWHGQFFSGLCNVIFCTQAANYGPTYELMAEARKQHPRAWSYQRDFWLTGTEFRPASFLPRDASQHRPRARDAADRRDEARARCRRAPAWRMSSANQQYGIPAGRPVSDDYHPGDEVLIADGVHDARAKVLAADGAAGTVTVAAVRDARPAAGRSPTRGRSPIARTLMARGCSPRAAATSASSHPHGTACYYWGRLDKEWDLAHRQYGRRLMANFADAHRRPRPRRPELDHRQGLCPVARGRPHDRRPHHRPLRRRRSRLHLERLQRARPGPGLLAS